MQQPGFDNELYLAEQSRHILERAGIFGNKLYLEFGGKLVNDLHAARILPGFDPMAKVRLLERLRDKAEILICVYAGDIERRKTRADFGITYDLDVLRLIDDLTRRQVVVRGVVVTRYGGEASADTFIRRLERSGVRVCLHRAIAGYPADVEHVVSEAGFGSNPYIETERSVVVVTGPGPGSGKLATCLNQIFHEHRRGVQAGYAKFETFPIWNLPITHPVNVAYEAAAADIGDVNKVDPFHLDAYGQTAVNYNRDIDAFPVVRHILSRLGGEECPYKSPTDMGVNRAGFAILDDDQVREAATQEVIRRFFRYQCEYKMGLTEQSTVDRVRILMAGLGCKETDRPVVHPAREAAEQARSRGRGHDGICCGAAVRLPDGRLVTGKNSALLHAASACVLNAVKQLAGIPDSLPLLSSVVLESVNEMKTKILRGDQVSLNLEETLIALSVSAATNPAAQAALLQLQHLNGCEMHLTHMPTPGDESGLRRLGVNLTCDPNFSSRFLHAE